MKEILNFTIENIKFHLFLDNGNLVYAKSHNGYLVYNLKDLEKENIKNVFYSLFPSNNLIHLNSFKFNQKEIKHSYDINKNFHIFFEKDKKISFEVMFLNYLFNNQEQYISGVNKSKKTNKQEEKYKYIKRNIKIGKKNISVLVLSTVIAIISLYPTNVIGKQDSHIKNHIENQSYIESKKVSYEEIVEVINQNPNLTDLEKEFFLSCPSYFIDNLNYFDYDTIMNNLRNLKIEYVENSELESKYLGAYYWSGNLKNTIKMFNANSFIDTRKSALSHEFLHSTSKLRKLDNILFEIVNVVFNDEYFGINSDKIYDTTYKDLRKYIYIIAEIIDIEALKKYHADMNIDYLIEEFVKIIPDKDLAIKLLINIDYIGKLEITNEDVGDLEEEYIARKIEVLDTLKLYYTAKYSSKIEDNIDLLYWINPNLVISKIVNQLGYDDNLTSFFIKYTKVKQYKKILDNKNPRELVLSIPNDFIIIEEYYTLEEVLNGATGVLYSSENEIKLKKLPDGRYIFNTYKPTTYLDYSLSNLKQSILKI